MSWVEVLSLEQEALLGAVQTSSTSLVLQNPEIGEWYASGIILLSLLKRLEIWCLRKE